MRSIASKCDRQCHFSNVQLLSVHIVCVCVPACMWMCAYNILHVLSLAIFPYSAQGGVWEDSAVK